MSDGSIRDLVTYQVVRDNFKRYNIYKQAFEDEVSDALIAAIDKACSGKHPPLQRAYVVIGELARVAGLDRDAARQIMLPLTED